MLPATEPFANLLDSVKPTRIYACYLKIIIQAYNVLMKYLNFNVILDVCSNMQSNINQTPVNVNQYIFISIK